MSRVKTTKERIVAILHDVVEDTQWKFEDLKKQDFPEEILEALKCLTKKKGEQYKDFVKRSASNNLALSVKLADLEDNMDVRRMGEVDEESSQRLQKYLEAWKQLHS